LTLDRDWSTYLLKCSDGSLYCGVTKDMENRLIKHNEGTASKYTRSRLPVKLAAAKGHLTNVRPTSWNNAGSQKNSNAE